MQRRQFLIAAVALSAWPAHAQTAPSPSGGAVTTSRPSPGDPPALITPQNELERSFLAALRDPSARPAFRRELMVSQIALALSSSGADAAPREVAIGPGRTAVAIFTSVDRLNGVFGPASARRVMSGRQAFELLRSRHVVLNYRLAPMLTLEPEDVAQYLAPQGPTP